MSFQWPSEMEFYAVFKNCVTCMGDCDLCDCPNRIDLKPLDCYDPIEEETLP